MREKRGNWGETERLVGSVQSNGRREETRGRQEDWVGSDGAEWGMKKENVKRERNAGKAKGGKC